MAVTKDSGFPVSARNGTPNATDVTWPTFTTPGTNRFVVAMFLGNGGTASSISSMTSPNLTWTNAVAAVDSGNNWRAEVWWAWAASAVTNEQIDTTFSGSPLYGTATSMLVWSFDGSDSSGAGNTASQNNNTDDMDISVTATGAGSYLLAGFPYRSSGGDQSVDANTTSEYDAGSGGGFGFNERAGSRTSSGAGALTLGWTGDDPLNGPTIVGFEVKQAAGGGGGAAVKQRITLLGVS